MQNSVHLRAHRVLGTAGGALGFPLGGGAAAGIAPPHRPGRDGGGRAAAAAAPGLDGGGGGRTGGGGAPPQGGAEAAAGGGTAQVEPLGRGERRRRAKLGAPRPERLSRAVCRAAEEVVYCMNEAELVDVALAVLAEVSPDPRGWGRGPGPSRGLPRPAQLPSSPGRALRNKTSLPRGLATGCPAGMGGLPLGTPRPLLRVLPG